MGDPKEPVITVYYRPKQSPPLEFDTTLPRGADGELIFRNDGHDGFWLYYVLDPLSFADLVFPNDPKQALCSAVISTPKDECPKTGCWPEFKPYHVYGNRILQVRNRNGKLPPGQKEVRFGYTLFVTKDPDGGTLIPLDPVGSNQNGPTSFNLKTLLIGAISFAALGTLCYVAVASRFHLKDS